MRKLLAGLLLAAATIVTPAWAQSDVSAKLRLMTFGGEAQVKSTTDAIARFNQKYPNVEVELGVDPISAGWGDFVSRVLRVSVGTLKLDKTLSRGQYRQLEDAEIQSLLKPPAAAEDAGADD